jgi:hypothetical protein
VSKVYENGKTGLYHFDTLASTRTRTTSTVLPVVTKNYCKNLFESIQPDPTEDCLRANEIVYGHSVTVAIACYSSQFFDSIVCKAPVRQ